MKTLATSTLLSIFLHVSAIACSCAYIPTFCETITYNNNGTIHSNYLIVHASVEDKFASGMKVRIIDVLFGQPDQTELVIANGNGADCRMGTSGFAVGDQFIFALQGESPDGFNLYECGVNLLTVEGDRIKGSIAPGITSMTFEEFLQLGDCGDLTPTLTTISVRPTLTSEEIRILTTSDLQFVNIDMYDMQGRRVFTRAPQILMVGNPLIIPTDLFASGCYTIVVEANGLRKIFRVVIV